MFKKEKTKKKQKQIRNADCGDIQGRCIMKRLVSTLMRNRRDNGMHSGHLGPATFTSMASFLSKHGPTSYQCPPSIFSRKQYEKMICIGDIHGDLLALLTALFVLGCIDDRARWKTDAQKVIVVICGDVMDRTRHHVDPVTRESKLISDRSFDNPREEVDVIQYLHALNIESSKSSSKVVCLLGNHEVCTSFPNISQCRGMENTFQNAYYSRGWVDDGSTRTKAWTDAQVMTEKMSMFSAGRSFAQYMAVHFPLVIVVGNFILVHGGINISILNNVQKITGTKETKTLTSMNQIMSKWLFHDTIPTNKQIQNELLSLVWNRELAQAQQTDVTCAKKLYKVFKSLGLDWNLGGVVVGHTVQPNLSPTCSSDGIHKVWRVDLALSEAFGTPTSTGGIIVRQTPDETIVHTHQFKKNQEIAHTYVNGRHSKQSSSMFMLRIKIPES